MPKGISCASEMWGAVTKRWYMTSWGWEQAVCFHLFTDALFVSMALLTWVVSGHVDDRQRHQQVSHDFCESIPDLLWGFSIFQVFICYEDVDGRGLEQEGRLDHLEAGLFFYRNFWWAHRQEEWFHDLISHWPRIGRTVAQLENPLIQNFVRTLHI